jgi:type II secretory pathway pseudopilin PulG
MSINLKSSPRRAFTIFEVMLALTLLVVLVGGLFGVLQACMESAAELQSRQQQNQSINGFIELFRRTVRNLPVEASMEGGQFEEGSGQFLQKIYFRNAPRAFAWGEDSLFLGETILSARPQVGGLFSLGVYRSTESEQKLRSSEADDKLRWLFLIKDLREIKWRFFDPRSGVWQEEWRDASSRPTLIEMNLTLAGETNAITSVFWVPTLNPSLNQAGNTAP